MISVIKKIFPLLEGREQTRLLALGLVFIVSGLLELVGIASILPLISLLANPDAVYSDPILSFLYDKGQFDDFVEFSFFVSLCVLGVLVITNLYLAFAQWCIYRFGAACDHSLSMRLIKQYLGQPYPFFVERNSSELTKNALQEVNIITYQIVIPLLTVVAKSIVTIFILGFLFYADPVLALIVGGLFSIIYGTIYLTVRKKMASIGAIRLQSNTARYKSTNEMFSGIKDIKAIGSEGQYIQNFKPHSQSFTSASATNQIMRQIPRYFIEMAAFGSVVVIILYMLGMDKNLDQILPIISLYALAGYRLMPAMQQIFSNIMQMRFAAPTLDTIYKELKTLPQGSIKKSTNSKTTFKDKISFNNVTFAHKKKKTLQSISLDIVKGQKIGIVGTTGAGKTTFVDLFLGLLEPESGTITIDNKPFSDIPKAKRQNIMAYVAQSIYLADSTLTDNITFAQPYSKKRLLEAAKQACLDEFITSELSDGYNTLIGERGVSLSGGQRQRVGLARAFYRQSDILILDEATSALDNETEDKIMQSIYQSDQTVLIIAHRLSTLKKCDVIYMFEKGKIVVSGSFNTLKKSNKAFQNLIKKAEV